MAKYGLTLYHLPMKETFILRDYVPKDLSSSNIEFQDDLLHIIRRIAKTIPSKSVWEFFSSSPQETGGKINFPYFRVDKTLSTMNIDIYILTKMSPNPEEDKEVYNQLSSLALQTILWVDVGFEGLENLARSKASVNWTTGVGHFPESDEKRAEGIIEYGNVVYPKTIRKFERLRNKLKISDDCFSNFNLDYLLDKFR